MDKLVIDSNIYIDFFNAGKFADLFYNVKYPTVIYLSSIVPMELRAGAFTRTDIKIVQALARTYRKSRRVLVPGDTEFLRAGEMLAKLQEREGYDLKKRLRSPMMCSLPSAPDRLAQPLLLKTEETSRQSSAADTSTC